MAQVFCQQFKTQIGELGKLGSQVSELLEQFNSSADSNYARKIEEGFSKFEEDKTRFLEEYQARTIEMLSVWFKTDETTEGSMERFKEMIKFEDSGRVVIEGGIFIDTYYKDEYLPTIIRVIKDDFSIAGRDRGGRKRFGRKPEPIEKSCDHLEEVGGKLDINLDVVDSVSMRSLKSAGSVVINNSAITTFDSLENVEGLFSVVNNKKFKTLPKLKTAGSIQLTGTTVSDFREAFPVLESAGIDHQGNSFYVNSDSLKEQLERLRGEIKFDGKIMVSA